MEFVEGLVEITEELADTRVSRIDPVRTAEQLLHKCVELNRRVHFRQQGFDVAPVVSHGWALEKLDVLLRQRSIP